VDGFATAIINYCEAKTTNVPKQFYETYNWTKIIERLEL
jgi:hypothetical protein